MSPLRRRVAAALGAASLLSSCAPRDFLDEAAIPSAPRTFPRAYRTATVRLAGGHFEAQAPATAVPRLAGASFSWPLGARELRCDVHPDPWTLATQVQGKVRDLALHEPIGRVSAVVRLGPSGRPYLVAEAVYGRGDDKRLAQFGAFGSSEGTVVCATEGASRVVEVLAVIEALAESQRWSEESAREPPAYAETSLVYLGETAVGFEYRYLRPRGPRGLAWFKIRGLTGHAGEAALSAIDDVTIEHLDDDRNVREARVLLVSDGHRTYDLTVAREPDGSLSAHGSLAGRAVERVLPSDRPIGSDLSLAPELRVLAAGISGRVAVRRLVIEGTQLRVADDAYTKSADGRVLGPGGNRVLVDELGLVHRVEELEPGETAALRIDRVSRRGAIPAR